MFVPFMIVFFTTLYPLKPVQTNNMFSNISDAMLAKMLSVCTELATLGNNSETWCRNVVERMQNNYVVQKLMMSPSFIQSGTSKKSHDVPEVM